jgi:predicted peptidase
MLGRMRGRGITVRLVLAALCVMGAAASAAALPSVSLDQAVPTGRSTYRLPIQDPAADHVNYLLYVPPGARAPATGWPLILFLHGTEQRGDDPSVLQDLAILTFADEEGQFPFVAVVPQCPRGQHWSPSVLKQLLDAVRTSVPVDRHRVYLTGFSMGGYGVWQTAAAMPGTFAAIAPLCGMSDLPDAPALATLPVWVFHGARDQNVPLSESLKMVKALRGAGGDPLLTVYPDRPHDIWTMTYHDSRLYLWFLSHSLSDGSPSVDSRTGDRRSDDSRIAASSLSSDALLDR